jgi:hypothetical protein
MDRGYVIIFQTYKTRFGGLPAEAVGTAAASQTRRCSQSFPSAVTARRKGAERYGNRQLTLPAPGRLPGRGRDIAIKGAFRPAAIFGD